MIKCGFFNAFLVSLLFFTISSQAATPLDFQEAWHRIQQYNPALKAECWDINASAGKVEQAHLLPNPTVGVTVENIGVKTADGQEVQSTLSLNQPILLGNKYHRRINLKNAEYQVQQRAYSLAYATLYAEAGQKYVDVLVAQHLCQTMQESARLARLTVGSIKQRNDAGKSSLLELKSAQIAFGQVQIQLQEAEIRLKIAQAELAALWGGCEKEINDIQDIGLPHTLLPLTTLLDCIAKSPLMQHAKAQSKAGFNQVLANQSEAWPDVNVGVGFRHFQHTNDNAMVAGISMPLPLFDLNQGNVHSSMASYSEKLASQQAIALSVKKQVYVLYQKISQAEFEMKILSSQLIPTTASAFDLAKNGYLQGRFSYLDLLNSQQKLIDARYRYWQIHGVRDKTLVELYAMLGLIVH